MGVANVRHHILVIVMMVNINGAPAILTLIYADHVKLDIINLVVILDHTVPNVPREHIVVLLALVNVYHVQVGRNRGGETGKEI